MSVQGFSDRWWTARDGLRLHARDYGGGAGDARLPVLCIHGLTRNARDFEDVAPWIAATGRRVLAVDVRGRGQSAYDPQPMNYHPGTYAQDMLALMDQLGIMRAVFIGTSMGGLITMTVSALHKTAVAAAVLNDVGPELSPVGLGRILSYVGKSPVVNSWADAAAAAKFNNQVAFPHNDDAQWMAFARRAFREGDGGVPVLDYDMDIMAPLRALGAGAAAPNLWPMFRKMARHRPTLLIRGGTSDLLDAKIAQKMRRAAPTMRYAEVPGVGHAPMLDEPQAKGAILDFLAAIP
jgi:pimeloyl-ACP methyl ester carboxylesterase